MPIFFRLFWHLFDMFDFWSASKIEKILKKEKPDLVITNNLKGISFLLPILLKKLNIKHIHVLHDMQLIHPSGLMLFGEEAVIDSLFAKTYSLISSYLFSFCGMIISPSQWLLEQHLQRGFFKKIKTEIAPNPAVVFKGDKLDVSNKRDIFQFLYVGQVEKYKGVGFITEAFVGVNNAKLIVVGDGGYLPRLREKFQNSKNIIFTGKKPKEDVLNTMFESDCLIVPSLCYENSPTVIYEAMATGLPVMASKIGGITEFIDEIGGILFQPGDKNDIKDKIDWVLKNPQKLVDLRIDYKINNGKYQLKEYIGKILKNIPNI